MPILSLGELTRGWARLVARATAARAASPRRISIAVATRDGRAINATVSSASSFVLYELARDELAYIGLRGCAFAQPEGRRGHALRRKVLQGVDLVLAVEGSSQTNRVPRGARLVSVPSAVPIAALRRELDAALAASPARTRHAPAHAGVSR